jgi:hypothetical protein
MFILWNIESTKLRSDKQTEKSDDHNNILNAKQENNTELAERYF